MAGYIRKRGTRADGSIKWQARYWDKDDLTRRYEKVFRTKGEAQAWLTTQANAQLTGTHIDPRKADKPFREVAQAWRETWVDIEPKTRVGYEAILRANLLPEFGGRKVSTITPALVQSYVARLLKEGAAPGTVRNIYAVLRNALNTAVRLKVITVNPCQGVKLPRMPREPMLFLSAAEVVALAAEVAKPVDKESNPTKPRPEYAVLVYTAAYTGLRAGELLALTRADVDLLHGKLHVRRALKELNGSDLDAAERGLHFGPTKNHTARTVGLPKFLVEMLREHLAGSQPSGTAPDALVFPSATGLPLRHNLWYRRHFKPAVKRALPERLHGLRFHDLRHTAASLLIAAGAHPKAIQERLGHSTIQITMDRYGHLLPSTDAALTDALDAMHSTPANVVALAR
jgi:integrase